MKSRLVKEYWGFKRIKKEWDDDFKFTESKIEEDYEFVEDATKFIENHKKLLNNLEDIRKSAGLTQHELSIKAEVSRKSINAIENGVYVPSTVLALKIAKTLNCKVEELFQLP